MRLSWDDIGSRLFKVGIDRGVLYPLKDGFYSPGVAWSGLTGVDDGKTGHEATPLYSGDRIVAMLFNCFEDGGTIKCYTYPDEFDACIGNIQVAPGLFAASQDTTGFALCYRRNIGNDAESTNFGYELHIVYGAYVTQFKDSAATLGKDVKAQELTFEYQCTVEESLNHDPTAHVFLSTRFIDAETMAAIETILYGDSENDPRLLLPDELYELLQEDAGDEE